MLHLSKQQDLQTEHQVAILEGCVSCNILGTNQAQMKTKDSDQTIKCMFACHISDCNRAYFITSRYFLSNQTNIEESESIGLLALFLTVLYIFTCPPRSIAF